MLKLSKKDLKELLDLLKKPILSVSSYVNYNSFVADMKLSAEKDCPLDPLTAYEYEKLIGETSLEKHSR